MKKFLLFTGIAVLVLAIGAYVTLQFFLGSIVTAGVNKFGPSITQTTVVLDSAHISPLSGVGTLSGFTVGNPEGWSPEKAFHLGTIHVDMEPFSIFRDHIVINEIIIEQPEFNYETKIISSNIGDLLKNIEASTGGGKAPAAVAVAKNGKPIKMVIKKFVLRNAQVRLGFGPKTINLPMPPIELNDIGAAEGGATPAAVAYAVMRSVTSNVIAASTGALTKVGGTSGAAAAEGVKKAGEAIKNLFDGKKNP